MRKPLVMVTIGTRPEAIKMAPVIAALRADARIETLLCSTGQHREMLAQALQIFDLKPDIDLAIMQPGQTLTTATAAALNGLAEFFKTRRPDRLVVHGDTLTTLSASLSAFYHQIPVAHVEAGLRTGRMDAPWPEEGNRRITSVVADMHFAPTESSKQNLLREGVTTSQIFVTGNTVIDALLAVSKKLDTDPQLESAAQASYGTLDTTKRLLLVTGHRRENFGEGFKNLCSALRTLARRGDIEIVYPVHLNPNVRDIVMKELGQTPNVRLIKPLDYLPFISLMKKAAVILTDSGGIQEEAPSLGKPVLVMRDVTERPEAIEAGCVRLVGTNTEKIVSEVSRLLDDAKAAAQMSRAQNPYGDGHAAERIAAQIIRSLL
jgi:UDP-N-acetylglucosamine 2-epimerase (non-hydrolysing)